MSALMIRSLPDDVHTSLRRLAGQWHMSVEAVARKALCDLVEAHPAPGVDFARLDRDRAALGFAEDGPAWDEALDDPAFSRKVLGLD